MSQSCWSTVILSRLPSFDWQPIRPSNELPPPPAAGRNGGWNAMGTGTKMSNGGLSQWPVSARRVTSVLFPHRRPGAGGWGQITSFGKTVAEWGTCREWDSRSAVGGREGCHLMARYPLPGSQAKGVGTHPRFGLSPTASNQHKTRAKGLECELKKTHIDHFWKETFCSSRSVISWQFFPRNASFHGPCVVSHSSRVGGRAMSLSFWTTVIPPICIFNSVGTRGIVQLREPTHWSISIVGRQILCIRRYHSDPYVVFERVTFPAWWQWAGPCFLQTF